MPSWFGLVLALVSAIMVNWAYTLEHDAAAALPRLTARRPIHSARSLLRNRAWLRGFGAETAGWLVYVAALRLAPLALVQAVSAAGIAVLALVTARGHPRRLARHEQIAVLVAMAGLALLGFSLTEVQPSDHRPNGAATAVWLAAVIGGALALTAARVQLSRVAALGLAAGLLFAGGDMSAKLVVYGGAWLLALFPLVLSYGLGTSVLQGAFQRGNALTSAGIATLATNAVPIAAGFVLFDEALPQGYRAPVQIAAFASIVLSAVLLGRPRPQRERGDRG